MIRITTRTFRPLLTATSLILATSALAQAPTDAQRAAIKSNCRSDYMAHCSSIPPGGAASLQCLQQNMASLSGACAGAVKAVSAPSETKAETPAAPRQEKQESKQETAPAAAPVAPAAEAEKPAATATAAPKAETKAATSVTRKPTAAQRAAIKSACRSDYMANCSSVPPGGAASLQCLEKNKARLSPACEKAVAAAAGGSVSPAAARAASPASANAAPAAAAPAAAPPPLLLRPMRPREVLFVMRSACGADVRTLCGDVPAGGGRIIECLASQSASLSQPCREVLGQFAR